MHGFLLVTRNECIAWKYGNIESIFFSPSLFAALLPRPQLCSAAVEVRADANG